MSVLVTITYEIRATLRDAYLEWAGRLRHHLTAGPGDGTGAHQAFRFYEDREQDNRFTEVYWLAHPDDLYTFEDQDPETSALMREAAEFQEDPDAVEYRVLLECDGVTDRVGATPRA